MLWATISMGVWRCFTANDTHVTKLTFFISSTPTDAHTGTFTDAMFYALSLTPSYCLSIITYLEF